MTYPIELKWFPPSWIQIKTEGRVIYIDPAYLRTYYSRYPKKIEYSKWPDPIDGLPEKLEKADIILVTHHHKDHCKKETVNRLKKQRTKVIAPKQCMKELGDNIVVIVPGMELDIYDIHIRAVEAYNKKHKDKTKSMHKKGAGVGYIVTVEGKSLYHAGDTDLIPEIGLIGNIDIALLPIGGRGFTMDINDAVKAAKRINPRLVVPMHRFDSSAEEYKNTLECESAIKVVPLGIGEAIKI